MTFPDLPDETPARGISFTAYDVEPPRLLSHGHEALLVEWLAAVAKTHGAEVVALDYVLCSDAFLHAMNVEHLGHDTLTDVITFDLRDRPPASPLSLEGECYISLERVRENALVYAGEDPAYGRRDPAGRVPVADLHSDASEGPEDAELLRVFAHGLLHLCGLGDKSPEEAARMRAAEERALYIWRSPAAAPGDAP